MAKGVLRDKPLHAEEQYIAVDDTKLRMTITALSDRYSQQIQDFIYQCYQDDQLAMIYRGIRMSGRFQHGGKSKVRRKIVEFPNAYVYDFVDTTMTARYGANWISERKALTHDLVKPWHVIENFR